MHHNYHVFEPGAPACAGQRFRPTVPRKYCVIQGLPGSGKSTLANAIGDPYFPYFSSMARNKPTVVLVGTQIAPGGVKPQCTRLSCSLFHSATADSGTLSRSLSDLEVRQHTARTVGDCGGESTQRSPDIRCLNPFAVFPIDLEPTSLAAAHNPSIDLAVQAALVQDVPQPRTAPASEISFVRIEDTTVEDDDQSNAPALLVGRPTGERGDALGLGVAAPKAKKRIPLGIVESQRIDERPAMHLIHTVVFVMSADEAFSNHRSPSASGRLWADRNAAVVSSMSAVTTCDGDRCRCCLVVNLDHFVFPGASAGCETGSAFSRGANADDWEDVGMLESARSSSSSQSAVFDGSGDLEEARMALARKWRISPCNVFLFSCRRVLADRSLGNVASPIFASETDASEFATLLAFIESNHARGESEWAAAHPPAVPKPALHPSRATVSPVPLTGAKKMVRFSIERESEAYVPPQEAPSVVASFISERTQREEQLDSVVLEQQRSRSEEMLAILREARLRENEVAMRVSARSNNALA